jgi:integrase
MAYSTTFYLKEPKKKGDTLVMMLFTFNYQFYKDGKKHYGRVRYSTGEKINPDFWSIEHHRASQTKDFPYAEFNYRLLTFKNTVENVYRKFINDNVKDISPAMIRNELDMIYGRGTRKAPESFLTFVDRFISTVRFTGKGRPINALTIKKYRNTYNILKDFEADKRSFDFANIDKQFYEDLLSYLQTEKKFSLNTCGKVIKVLKLFLKQAVEKGKDFNLKAIEKFTAPMELTDKVYLTLPETEKIYGLNLGTTLIGNARDLFLCACYTGLRFSDLSALQKENIITLEKKQFLQVRTYKTGETVTLPLHPMVSDILKKYQYKMPAPVTNQVMNRYLKTICQRAKINQKVSVTESVSGKRVVRTCEKWELVSTHTGRRSFATNSYLAGVPAQSIMKLTGHKTEASFLSYIRAESEAHAIRMNESDFFKGNGKLRVV